RALIRQPAAVHRGRSNVGEVKCIKSLKPVTTTAANRRTALSAATIGPPAHSRDSWPPIGSGARTSPTFGSRLARPTKRPRSAQGDAMTRKYELTDETTVHLGRVLYRIRAV